MVFYADNCRNCKHLIYFCNRAKKWVHYSISGYPIQKCSYTNKFEPKSEDDYCNCINAEAGKNWKSNYKRTKELFETEIQKKKQLSKESKDAEPTSKPDFNNFICFVYIYMFLFYQYIQYPF